MASRSYACWFTILVLALVLLHAMAREIPNPKNIVNQKSSTTGAVDEEANDNKKEQTTTLVNENNINGPSNKDVPKSGEVNNDDKHFISFGGVGAAGGVGGVAGIIPIDFLDKGLGAGIMPLPGGGLGGIGGGSGGGIGGGGGPGCPSSGGLVPMP